MFNFILGIGFILITILLAVAVVSAVFYIACGWTQLIADKLRNSGHAIPIRNFFNEMCTRSRSRKDNFTYLSNWRK